MIGEMFDTILLYASIMMVAILIVSVIIWFIDDCTKAINYLLHEFEMWRKKRNKKERLKKEMMSHHAE